MCSGPCLEAVVEHGGDARGEQALRRAHERQVIEEGGHVRRAREVRLPARQHPLHPHKLLYTWILQYVIYNVTWRRHFVYKSLRI